MLPSVHAGQEPITPTRSGARETGDVRAEPAQGARHGAWAAILAAIAFFAVALAFLFPTLVHGTVLAPFDMLSLFGLGHKAGVIPYNTVDSDLVQQDVPWLNLAWSQVHHGQLPLWNPYDGLGMPFGLDFITASFSVPTLLGYLAPVKFGLLISVLAKMVIAGTGVFFLGRVLGLRYLPAAFAGMIFELCGAFTVWLGWSQTGVMAWLGWILGAGFLIFSGRHRVRSIVLFAVVFALSIYGGHPESNVITAVALAVIVLVMLARRVPALGGKGGMIQPVVDFSIGSLCALGLSAPLWLPGVQLTSASVRYDASGSSILPLSDLGDFIFSGYNGLPVATSHYFGSVNYYDITAYLGVTVVALGALGVLRSRRRVELQALAAMMAVMGVILFFSPMFDVLSLIPHATGIDWRRALIPLSLGAAIFAGIGIDIVAREGMSRRVQHILLVILGCLASVLIVIGILSVLSSTTLSRSDAVIRARSFIWPSLETVLGLGVVLVLVVVRRFTERHGSALHRAGQPKRQLPWSVGGASVLALSVLGFLLSAGGPLFSPGQQYFPVTPAVTSLEKAVGSATVGFGQCPSVTGYANLGVLPDANIGYHLHELSFYETAVAPVAYYQSWAKATDEPLVTSVAGVFCPAISSVSLARRYGVEFILEPKGQPGPSGAVFKGVLGDESLYQVPGAGPATLAPASTSRSPVGVGTLVRVTHPDTAEWKMVTESDRASVLFVRLTDVPGWKATVDGLPVTVDRWDSVMMEIHVPAGRHNVELSYWPPLLGAGLLAAGLAALGLAVASVIAAIRKS